MGAPVGMLQFGVLPSLLALIDVRLLVDLVFATGLGVLVLGRVSEPRTLWLLRGYLLLVAMASLVQRYVDLQIGRAHV